MFEKIIGNIRVIPFLLAALFLSQAPKLHAQPAAVTQYGCFAQSGDGGDAIISDIGGYTSPAPAVAVQVTPLTTPPASWPSFCGSGDPISDNNYAYTTATV